MAIIIIIAGIISLVYGLLIVFGVIKTDISKDDETTKKLFSEGDRYALGRYYGGLLGIVAGLGVIVFGLLMYFSQ